MRVWTVGPAEDERAGFAAVHPEDRERVEAALDDGPWIRDWEPPELELVDGEPADFLACDLPLRLCSMRLRGIVEGHRAVADRVQWLPVVVFVDEQEVMYSALHLLPGPLPPDAERHVLDDPGDPGAFLVAPELANAIDEARCSVALLEPDDDD